MAKVIITMNSADSAAVAKKPLVYARKNSVANFAADAGAEFPNSCTAQLLNDDAAYASATVTVVNANVTADDTLKIGAMTLTAKASGATTNQFNIGASATLTAAAIALAINSYSSSLLTATSAAGVVTVKAAQTGTMGNAIAVTVTEGTPGGMTPSAAALSGGLADSAVAYGYQQFV